MQVVIQSDDDYLIQIKLVLCMSEEKNERKEMKSWEILERESKIKSSINGNKQTTNSDK